MKLTELINEYNSRCASFKQRIRELIPNRTTESGFSGSHAYVNVMFRGECDYSILIPFDYCEDIPKLKDYLDRFSKAEKEQGGMVSYSFSKDFLEAELKRVI